MNLNCKDCAYAVNKEYTNHLGNKVCFPVCIWESRCPGDIPPCEEEESYTYEPEDYPE